MFGDPLRLERSGFGDVESTLVNLLAQAQSKPFETRSNVNVDASSNVVAIVVVAAVGLVVAAALLSTSRAPQRRGRRSRRR